MLPVIQTNCLFLPSYKGVQVVNTGDIIRIEAISNYSKLHFANGKTLVVAKVLRWFEEQLPASQFIRIHRSHIISLGYVQICCNSHNSKIILQDNTAIGVSRRKKGMVMKIFMNLQAA